MSKNFPQDSRLTIGVLYSLPETISDEDYLKAILKHAAHIFFPLDDDKTVELNDHGPEGDSILHLACGMGDLKAVRILVAAGLDVNSRAAEMNETPLSCAVGNSTFLDIIHLLLEKGADPDLKDNFGYSPRTWAIQMDYKTVIEMFKKFKPIVES